MRSGVRATGLVLAGLLLAGLAHRGLAAEEARFRLRHQAVVRQIPPGAKKARVWLALPREDPAQRVEEFRLTGPGKGTLSTGGTYENRCAYFEVENPGPELTVAAEGVVERRPARKVDDPVSVSRSAEALNERSVRFYEAELAPHRRVPVGDRYADLAREIAGEEKNPVLQARRLYGWLAEQVRVAPETPALSQGESERCLKTKAGGSADVHSLFASLARSLNIPARLVYGALLPGEAAPLPGVPSREGKDADAGHHCWAEFFALGVGWIPVDAALGALSPPERRDTYFGNLDARRVTLGYGRDLTLAPAQDGEPVDALWGVYVEIDGRPHLAWERKLTYTAAPAP